jgi:outer membrane protein assembly factor BamB
VDGLLYLISNRGEVNCLESATGVVVWTDRIGGNHIASPIYADGLLYFTSSQGTTKIIRAGRAFELVAENKLDDGLMASPAVAGKALFFRTPGNLYRIEAK